MERLLNQLGNAVTLICGLSRTCVVVLFVGGGLFLRTAGMGLFSLLGDLIVGRVDRTPTVKAALPRPVAGTALRTRAQSVDFDTAVRQQGGNPMPQTIQAPTIQYPPQATSQALGFPAQAPNAGYPPQAGYANPNMGYTAQNAAYNPTLQDVPPMTGPIAPSAGTIQPLYDNRVLGPQEMRAQAAPLPNQPYQNLPYQPLGGPPAMPSLSGQAPLSPDYQPLGGGYQPQAAPSADPNAFFPAPSGGIPRRAALSAPRDVSGDTMGQEGFDMESYPGLRNRRRRGAGQEIYDDQALTDREDREGGIGGVIGDLGNMLGL